MKKFLTMLLALSVVFTYTFGAAGSVYAAESHYAYGNGKTYATAEKAEEAYLSDVNSAEEVVLTALKSNYDIAVIKVTQDVAKASTITGATGAEVDAKYWLAQLEVEYADVKTAVLNKTRELKSENYAADDVVKVTAAAYNSVTKDDTTLMRDLYGTDSVEKYALAALKAFFDDYKADAVAKINSVDTTIYSTTDYTEDAYPGATYLWAYPTGGSTSKTVYNAKTVADETLKYAVGLVNGITYDATRTHVVDSNSGNAHDGITEVYASVDSIVSTYTTAGLAADGKTYAYTFKAQGGKSPYLKTQEVTDNANANAANAAAKADLEGKLAIALANAESLTPAQRALWDTVKDAYVEVETALLDGVKKQVADFPTVTFNDKGEIASTCTEALAYLAKVDLVDKYEAKAAALKLAKNSDGSAAYDAAKVDTILEGFVANIYAGTEGDAPVDSDFAVARLNPVTEYVKNELKATVDGLVDADAYTHKIAVSDDNTTVSEAGSATEYYAKEFVGVTAAVDAYKAAVDAATTNVDLIAAKKALKEALANVDAKSAIVYDKATRDAVDAAEEMAAAYVATLNAGKDPADKLPTAPADLTEWFKENGARSAADVKALYETLKAELAEQLSENAVKAAVKELQGKIDALPASLTVTVTDEANILDCKKAFEALAEKYIATPNIDGNNTLKSPYNAYSVNATALGKAYAALLKIKQNEIIAAEKAIAKEDCSAVTVADKEAVKNVLSLQEAYKAITGSYYADAIGSTGYNRQTWVKKAIETISDIEAKAIVSAVAALPAEVKVEDKAAIEAARKAYDAYVAEYTRYDNKNIFASANDAKSILAAAPYNFSIEKLEAAEIALAAAEKAAADAEKIEEALKAAEEAKAEAEKAKAEAEAAAKAAEEAKAEAEKAAADKAAAEAAQKEAEEKAAAAEAAKVEADKAKAEAEAAQAAAEQALADAQTKIKVMNTTAKVSKATATKTSVKLTFAKPAVGADGYKVYMATSKNGTYKLVGTTTGTTFTKKSLKAGKTYYFKVKAYKTVAGAKVYTKTSAKFAKATAK